MVKITICVNTAHTLLLWLTRLAVLTPLSLLKGHIEALNSLLIRGQETAPLICAPPLSPSSSSLPPSHFSTTSQVHSAPHTAILREREGGGGGGGREGGRGRGEGGKKREDMVLHFFWNDSHPSSCPLSPLLVVSLARRTCLWSWFWSTHMFGCLNAGLSNWFCHITSWVGIV